MTSGYPPGLVAVALALVPIAYMIVERILELRADRRHLRDRLATFAGPGVHMRYRLDSVRRIGR